MKSENEPTILVIEDEVPIRRFLKVALTDHGYAFKEAQTGQEGIAKIASDRPDLVILDLGLPDLDGLEVTRQLREWSDVPVIILSARGHEKDKVEALDAGADDYLTKPFGVHELLARVRVALRHAAKLATRQEDPEYRFGNIRVDFGTRCVFVDEKEVGLTRIEYKLLLTLIKYAGKVVTQKHLLKEIWGEEYGEESNYLRVYMAHLRRKLEQDSAHPKYFITEAGVGYRLKVE
ncbi:MAG: DNA-binding response regulator [Candidatus Melainabacteria bacterium]|nr:MAG: DNA-binding response regulator [Candidatus Melainabacteria bacterium]